MRIVNQIKSLFSAKQRREVYEENIKSANEFLECFEELNYFSYSDMQRLNLKYQSTYFYFKRRRFLKLNNNIRVFLNQYSNLEGNRRAYNDEFIKNELIKQNSFLSNIDGKSLDHQQRQAVIVEEDNNLVVAGAGSGKTLTIAAKVSYLVKCLDVDPEKILLITFTNKAAKEMRERVIAKLGINVEVKTFHSLGNQIISQSRKSKPTICEDSKKIIESFIADKLVKDMSTLEKLVRFYGSYLSIPEDLDQFDEFGSYLEAQSHIDLQTLKSIRNEHISLLVGQGIKVENHVTLRDERVKSAEELAIANFLFLNGIRYEYEANYAFSTSTEFKRQYKPDFYLPDYNIYIEHFGINKQGKTPWLSEFEEQEYLSGIEWKRELHKKNNTTLYETYSYQCSEGNIFDILRDDLMSLGVEFKSIQAEELMYILKGMKNKVGFNEFIKLLSTFLNLYKSSGYSVNDIERMITIAKKNKNRFIRQREILFFEIFKEFYNYYQEALEMSKSIDFNDMINEATKLIVEGETKLNYKYIIIDEYQDISKARYQLIKAIKDQCHSKVMAVGDDWQSIYRFAGSDIKLFTNFEKMFGATEILKIEKTYRNSQQVIDLAGSFIMKNELQLKKELKSDKSLAQPISVIYYNDLEQALLKALQNISTDGSDEQKHIMLLGRNNGDIDFIRNNQSTYFKTKYEGGEHKIYCATFENLHITFSTVHKSKGLEADDVIVLNCVNNTCGFPNKISDDPILRYVLTDPDAFPYGEERRLFYVALTRTKNKCILLAPAQQSIFVKELVEVHNVPYEVMSDCTLTNVKCPRCMSGNLTIREDSQGREFLGCSNYPGCNKTFKDVKLLDYPITCPNCGDYLIERKGPYGSFRGCLNYPKCTHTEAINNR